MTAACRKSPNTATPQSSNALTSASGRRVEAWMYSLGKKFIYIDKDYGPDILTPRSAAMVVRTKDDTCD